MTDERGPLTVDVAQLRTVVAALLEHVEREEGPYIEVDRDYNWLIEAHAAAADDLHEPGTQESDLGVGQVSDDLATVDELAKDLAAGDVFFQPWHDLEHVVGILRALARRDLPDLRDCGGRA